MILLKEKVDPIKTQVNNTKSKKVDRIKSRTDQIKSKLDWLVPHSHSLEFMLHTRRLKMAVHKLQPQKSEGECELWPVIIKYARSRSLFKAL